MENKKNFYIDGKWVTAISKEEIKVINPATEEECAVISLGNKEDVDLAVNAAKKAYSSWAFSPKEERIRLLEKLYENYKKDGQILPMQLLLKWVLQKTLLQNFKLEQVQLI